MQKLVKISALALVMACQTVMAGVAGDALRVGRMVMPGSKADAVSQLRQTSKDLMAIRKHTTGPVYAALQQVMDNLNVTADGINSSPWRD